MFCWIANIRFHSLMTVSTKKVATRASQHTETSTEDTEDSAPATRVLRQFRVVVNAVKVHFRQVEKDTGIGGAQVWALSVIQSQPKIGMNELAQAMDVHQSTASNLVKSLLQQEMISAEKHPIDRRSVMLTILPKGKKVLKSAPAPFTGVLIIKAASWAETAFKLQISYYLVIISVDSPDQRDGFVTKLLHRYLSLLVFPYQN